MALLVQMPVHSVKLHSLHHTLGHFTMGALPVSAASSRMVCATLLHRDGSATGGRLKLQLTWAEARTPGSTSKYVASVKAPMLRKVMPCREHRSTSVWTRPCRSSGPLQACCRLLVAILTVCTSYPATHIIQKVVSHGGRRRSRHMEHSNKGFTSLPAERVLLQESVHSFANLEPRKPSVPPVVAQLRLRWPRSTRARPC
jgi:hypothetical protein